MPPNALNLINHMKLHVNGKMAERERDRKKKEQESAEAIRRLKISHQKGEVNSKPLSSNNCSSPS